MRFGRHSSVVALLAAGTAGCFIEDLLSVEATDRVPSSVIEDPANAGLTVRSAIADFECAFANYIVATGLVGDELADSQTDLRMWDYDRRTVDSTGTPVYAVSTCSSRDPGVYQTLQTARYSADTALQLLESPAFIAADIPRRVALAATMAAYAGYSYLLLGETLCAAAVNGGPLLTASEMLQRAEEKFTLAIDRATEAAEPPIVHLARVGRARTRLDLSRGTEAVADARLVPEGFNYNANYSDATNRSSNRVWMLNNQSGRVVVEASFRSFTHMGALDQRVSVRTAGAQRPAVDGSTRWIQQKYPAADSPIPIARYAEAQLIIAEVEGGTEAIGIINRLHAAAGLPDFTSADPNEILRHVIEERKIEFFLESRHFSDKLRYNSLLDPDPLPDAPPPGSSFAKGGTYGASRCLPLPDVERLNNDNIP